MSYNGKFRQINKVKGYNSYAEWMIARKDREEEFHPEIGMRALKLARVIGIESTQRYVERDDYLGFFIDTVRSVTHSNEIELGPESNITSVRFHIERSVAPFPFLGIATRLQGLTP